MVRESLFAILGERCVGSLVLDLFAGAGTLGIEALSRGAAHATFVERSPRAVAALRRNLGSTSFTDRGAVVQEDVLAWLDRLEGRYDLVFCDPPFTDAPTLDRVLAHGRLRSAAAGGLLVARALRKRPPTLPQGLRAVRERAMGEQTLHFLEYSAA